MEIVENDRNLLSDFIHLNEEWIASYFELEDADHALAANPGQIIDNGGYIFSLLLEDKVVGVCALFNDGEGTFELARMAVSPQSQGNGYGDKLMSTCLAKLAEIGAQKVYLLSNTKLKAAIELYKKHGFKAVSHGQHPVYSRANIVMECNIQ